MAAKTPITDAERAAKGQTVMSPVVNAMPSEELQVGATAADTPAQAICSSWRLFMLPGSRRAAKSERSLNGPFSRLSSTILCIACAPTTDSSSFSSIPNRRMLVMPSITMRLPGGSSSGARLAVSASEMVRMTRAATAEESILRQRAAATVTRGSQGDSTRISPWNASATSAISTTVPTASRSTPNRVASAASRRNPRP